MPSLAVVRPHAAHAIRQRVVVGTDARSSRQERRIIISTLVSLALLVVSLLLIDSSLDLRNEVSIERLDILESHFSEAHRQELLEFVAHLGLVAFRTADYGLV